MITDLFNIALNSIKVAQQGLDVTGNNVANLETPGYTRRSLVIDQLPHNRGSSVTKIKREFNPFVSRSWQDSMAPLGYFNVKDEVLNQLEGIFNELDGGGMKEALKYFWDSWEMVANDSSDISLRSNLIQASKNLVSNIHFKKEQLIQIRKSLDPEIGGLIKDINRATQQVAKLNSKIKFGKVANQDITNLMDERDNILRKLSEELGIRSVNNKDGQVTILIEGQAIVVGNQNFNLSWKTDDNGNIKILWNNDVDITSRVLASSKGKLSAYIEMRDSIIPDYMESLDKFAYNLADTINTQHKNGYDLNGDGGQDFFIIDPDDPASSIKVNINDPKKIAAASSPDTIPSDNRNALAILNIKDQPISSIDGLTIDDFYNKLIADVGTKSNLNKTNLKLQDKIVENAESYFDSISGVNLDEEAMNTLKFQYMYTASARLVSVASEITKTVINMGA